MGGLHPAFIMIIAVVSYSTFPVLFKLGGAGESPFLFTGLLQGGVGIGLGVATLFFKRRLLTRPEVIEDIQSHFNWKLLLKRPAKKDIESHSKARLMLISIVGSCGFVLFALGLAFVDISVAAILFETRPLFLMLLVAFLFKGTKRYNRITLGTLIFVFLAFAGVALVILSHNTAPQPLQSIGSGFASTGTLIGVAFVLAAAICGATRGSALKMGASLAETHSQGKKGTTDELAFVVFMNCIGNAIAGGVLCAIGLILSETVTSHQMLYAIMAAILVDSVGIVAVRAANLKTDELGVNALAYMTPLVALVWLWTFSILDVSHLDYLVIGAMGVMAANLLINTKAEKRIAYNALVVSLWVFGTVVWFTGEYLTDISLTTNVPLELPVTMFILILAFRVDRLVRRTSQEEQWVFEAFHKLEFLSAKKKVDDEAGRLLMEIDRSEPSALNGVYESLLKYIPTPKAQARMDKSVADDVTHVRHLVDNLVHSRQQGGNFGELIAIAIAGGLIVAGLLFFREHEIFSDIAAFLLSSVVVFLLFNIVDLQNDRSDPIIRERDDGQHTVKFDNVGSRKIQQRIAVSTSLVMVSVFVCMFWWR